MKKEDLMAGETILISKEDKDERYLYMGSTVGGFIHFISYENNHKSAINSNYTIEDLERDFTIEQPQSKAVPLERKVYDFVPVRVRDYSDGIWESAILVAVTSDDSYPYVVLDSENSAIVFKQCEFL